MRAQDLVIKDVQTCREEDCLGSSGTARDICMAKVGGQADDETQRHRTRAAEVAASPAPKAQASA